MNYIVIVSYIFGGLVLSAPYFQIFYFFFFIKPPKMVDEKSQTIGEFDDVSFIWILALTFLLFLIGSIFMWYWTYSHPFTHIIY
jgi:hypothetical protein